MFVIKLREVLQEELLQIWIPEIVTQVMLKASSWAGNMRSSVVKKSKTFFFQLKVYRRSGMITFLLGVEREGGTCSRFRFSERGARLTPRLLVLIVSLIIDTHFN